MEPAIDVLHRASTELLMSTTVPGILAAVVYFNEVDTARLQRHFLAALTVPTHAGLHRHTVERMAVVHRGVTTSIGIPITGEVWDVVVSTLIGVLVTHGAPSSVVEPLGALLDPLRAVIVVEP